MLNRLVGHPKTPLSTLKGIRDRSADREGEIWVMLHSYAARTLERILRESGGLHRGWRSVDEETDRRGQTKATNERC